MVLPWVPATAIVLLRAVSSASSSARERSGIPRSRAAARSRFSTRHGGGVDQLDPLAGGNVLGPVPDRGIEHAVCAQALQVGAVGAVGAAHLGAERVGRPRVAAHPRAADADEVKAPSAPGPGRGAHRSAASSSSPATCGRPRGERGRGPRPPSPPAGRDRRAARPPRSGGGRRSARGRRSPARRPPRPSSGVGALMVGGGVGVGDEDRRQPVGGDLEHRAPARATTRSAASSASPKASRSRYSRRS